MTEFILDLIQAWGYWGIAVLMFLENVFPPVPSEVIMGLGGIAVAQGRFDFWTLVAVAVAGTTAGNWVWYAIGRWIGDRDHKGLINLQTRAAHLRASDPEFKRASDAFVQACRCAMEVPYACD